MFSSAIEIMDGTMNIKSGVEPDSNLVSNNRFHGKSTVERIRNGGASILEDERGDNHVKSGGYRIMRKAQR